MVADGTQFGSLFHEILVQCGAKKGLKFRVLPIWSRVCDAPLHILLDNTRKRARLYVSSNVPTFSNNKLSLHSKCFQTLTNQQDQLERKYLNQFMIFYMQKPDRKFITQNLYELTK